MYRIENSVVLTNNARCRVAKTYTRNRSGTDYMAEDIVSVLSRSDDILNNF